MGSFEGVAPPPVSALAAAASDEPTSGLDSAAAFYVMAAVRRVAERQRTILA